MNRPSRRRRGPYPRPRVEFLETRQLLSLAGSPDTSFGGTGSVVVPVSVNFAGSGPSDVTQDSTAIQADGKILAAGTLTTNGVTDDVVVRLNADGSRDTSFGQDGQVLFTGEAAVSSVVVQADGKIIVAGLSPVDPHGGLQSYVAERFNADGSVDATYGASGVATLTTVPSGTVADLTSLDQATLDQSGDLVLLGTGIEYHPVNDGEFDTLFVVARITPAGQPDATFGQGGFMTLRETINGVTTDTPGGLAILADGKIVVGGSALNGEMTGSTALGPPVYYSQPVAFRLNADGSLDTTFGPTSSTPGIVTFTPVPSDPTTEGVVDVSAVAIDDGRFLIEATSVGNPSVIYGLDSTGALDPTFGTGGVATFVEGTSLDSMAIDPQGRIVAGGSINNVTPGSTTVTHGPAIVRFNADGSVDTSFGDENSGQIYGLSIPTFGGSASNFTPASLAVGADGSIFLAGQEDAVLGGAFNLTFGVAKVEPDTSLPPQVAATSTVSSVPAGSTDASFGGTGSVVVPVSTNFAGAGPLTVAQAATAVQADGKVLVVGTLANDDGGYTSDVLVRLDVDGSRDASFGQDGQVLFDSERYVTSVVVQPDGKILVAGYNPLGSSLYAASFLAERFDADGSVDATYGVKGVADLVTNMSDPYSLFALTGTALDANGDLVLVGNGSGGIGNQADEPFFVARFTPAGAVDTTFGQSGIAEIPVTFSNVTEDTSGEVAIQPDGKIVVSGVGENAEPTTSGGTVYYKSPVVFRLDADGTLDSTFGSTGSTPGIVSFDVNPVSSSNLLLDGVTGVAVDGGRIIVDASQDGDAALYGLTSSGALDTTFGTGGVAGVGRYNTLDSLTVDGQGRIVVGGKVDVIEGAGNIPTPIPAVARFNADGSIDTSLGDQNPELEFGFATPGFENSASAGVTPESLAVGPDGSIFLAGQVDSILGGALVPTFTVSKVVPETAVAPGSPAGTADPGFGAGGSSILPVASNFNSTGPTSVDATAVATQADGKSLVAGTIVEDGMTYLSLVRVEPDGSQDPNFGTGAQVLFADAISVASILVQSDGKILVVGNTLDTANGGFAETPEVVAVRFNADGTLDTTYSNNGVAQFGIAASGGALSTEVHVAEAALDTSGNLVIAGNAQAQAGTTPGTSVDDLFAARITPAGALDATFNSSGVEAIPVTIGQYTEDSAAGLAIQGDGEIVIGGNAVYGVNYTFSQVVGASYQTQPVVVRLNPDGTPDANFGQGGTVIIGTQADPNLPAGSVTINALTLDDGEALIGGIKSRVGGNLGVLYRLNPDGSLDDTFGNSGEASADDGSGITALEVMAGGQIVAATGDDSLYRFTAYGMPDPTFGNTTTPGLEAINYGAGTSVPFVNALAFAQNGDILVAGTTETVLGGDLVTVFAAAELAPNPTPAPNTIAGASAGDLDGTFGQGNGSATVTFPQDSAATATATAVQPNGDILLAGKELARLLPSGALDTSFGVGGTIALANGTTLASSVFVLPSGEIEVFGYINSLPVLLRYTASGQPDTTFGTNGQYSYPASKDPLFPASAKATMLADGSLVVAGDISDSIVASHINLDGSVDTAYGTGGATIVGVRVAAMTPTQTVAGVVVEPDGDVVIAGNVVTGTTPSDLNETDVFAIRLLPTGKVDTSFGGPADQGTVVLNPETANPSVKGFYSVTGVALESDGHIVLGGSTYGSAVVTVLNPDGSLDAAFGHLGVATVPTYQSPGGTQAGGGVIVEPNSQIVVVSTVSEANAAGTGVTTAMLAARFNTDGTLDTTFGNPDTSGVATYLPGNTIAQANAVTVQADGNVLIAGLADVPASGSTSATQVFAVARVKYQP